MPERRSYNPIWLQTQPIAHRGLHGLDVPEDSLAACLAAADAGYAIELDVRLTSDNQIIVNHDTTTGRLSGTNRKIKHATAAELTAMPLAGTGQTIPLLSDVLEAVAGRVPIDIEIKHSISPRIIGPKLLDLLANYPGEVVVDSFDPRIVHWFRRHAPNLPCGQIAGSLPEKSAPRWTTALLRAMLLNFWTRPQFIKFDVRDYPNRMLSFWQQRLHVPVILWTVRTPDQLALARRDNHNVVFEHLHP